MTVGYCVPGGKFTAKKRAKLCLPMDSSFLMDVLRLTRKDVDILATNFNGEVFFGPRGLLGAPIGTFSAEPDASLPVSILVYLAIRLVSFLLRALIEP